MTKNEKIGNIVAFLTIIFGEDYDVVERLMEIHPDYLIEKYERYIESIEIEHMWGLHPLIKENIFYTYLNRWEIPLGSDCADE